MKYRRLPAPCRVLSVIRPLVIRNVFAKWGRTPPGRPVKKYLARLDEISSTAPRVVDKHPINFRHLGLIAALFPKAAIIHCRRDPLDTCLSCYAQNFNAPIPWALQLDSLGFYYREYERLMVHWYEIMPGRILDFVYEEVVGDVETSVRRLIDHCGLPWQAQCLEFHQTQRIVRTASHLQVRQPLYSRSVGRWRNYEILSGTAETSPRRLRRRAVDLNLLS